MGKQNQTKMGLALVAGAAAGYIASLFMSEKTKKTHKDQIVSKADELASKLLSEEDKKRALDLFKSTAKTADKQLLAIKLTLAENITAAHKTLAEVDKKKYTKAVEKTVETLKKKGELNTSQLTKLKTYLLADYSVFKNVRDKKKA